MLARADAALDELEERLSGAAVTPTTSKRWQKVRNVSKFLGAARASPANATSNESPSSATFRMGVSGYNNLTLSGSKDGADLGGALRSLADALRSPSSTLEQLNLSFNPQLEADGMKLLAEALAANESVKQLRLSSCDHVDDRSVASLIDMQGRAASARGQRMGVRSSAARPLHDLILSGSVRVGNLTAHALARSMAMSSPLRLERVNLSGCKALSDEGVAAIGKALGQSQHALTSLSLAACPNLGDEGVLALAEGLRTDETLQVLDLAWLERLTDVSLVALSDALGRYGNKSLTTLSMTCCVELTDTGFSSLASALVLNSGLTSLVFDCCYQISEVGLADLARAMSKNRTLTELSLKGCPATSKRSEDLNLSALAWDSPRARAAPTPPSPRESPRFSGNGFGAGEATPRRSNPSSLQTGRHTGAEEASSPAAHRRASPRPAASSARLQTPFDRLDHFLYRNKKGVASAATAAGEASSMAGSRRLLGGGTASLGASAGGAEQKPPGAARMSLGQLKRTVRATIVQGATLYSLEKHEQCLRVFTTAAESVLAVADSAMASNLAATMKSLNANEANTTLPQRIWAVRQVFDTLFEEIEAKEEILQARQAEEERRRNQVEPPPFSLQLPPNALERTGAMGSAAADLDDDWASLGLGETIVPPLRASALRATLHGSQQTHTKPRREAHRNDDDDETERSAGGGCRPVLHQPAGEAAPRSSLLKLAAEQGLILV